MSGHPFTKTTVQGHEVDNVTLAGFLVAQGHPRKDNDWTVLQGCYTTANPSSGSTHAGSGAIDVSAYNWRERVRALRMAGWAAWHRPYNWDGAGGGEHIHAIQVGNDRLSPEAAAQVAQYVNYTNGLADYGADNSWHPFKKGGKPPVFSYDAYTTELARVAHLSAALERTKTQTHSAIVNAQNDAQSKALHQQLRALSHMRSEFRQQIRLYVSEAA